MKRSLVRHWMTKQVISTSPHTRLHDALRIMNRSQVRSLPVVEDDHLVGIVTKRDLLRADLTTVMKDAWDQYRIVGNQPLEKIMTSGVITVMVGSSAGVAARVMLENKINALPVVDEENNMVGILTSSDLFRMVMEELPLTGKDIRVRDYMTYDLETIDPNASMLDAQRLMATKRIRALPVVQEDELIGILTRTDLLSAAPNVAVTQGRLEVTQQVLSTPVRFIMTSSPITIQDDAPITEAAQIMLKHKIHCLPVMSSRHKLIGIITETDIFNLIVKHFL